MVEMSHDTFRLLAGFGSALAQAVAHSIKFILLSLLVVHT